MPKKKIFSYYRTFKRLLVQASNESLELFPNRNFWSISENFFKRLVITNIRGDSFKLRNWFFTKNTFLFTVVDRLPRSYKWSSTKPLLHIKFLVVEEPPINKRLIFRASNNCRKIFCKRWKIMFILRKQLEWYWSYFYRHSEW